MALQKKPTKYTRTITSDYLKLFSPFTSYFWLSSRIQFRTILYPSRFFQKHSRFDDMVVSTSIYFFRSRKK